MTFVCLQSRRNAYRRSASVAIYVVLALPALCGLMSLAVDLGRVQLAKAELQRAADATAHFAASSLDTMNDSDLRNWTTRFAYAHTADAKPVVLTAADIEYGTWNSTTNVFTSATKSSATAIRITAQRTAARSNSVPLIWGKVIGRSNCDVKTVAIANVTPAKTLVINIDPKKGDPWLAGMPPGSTASYDDTAPANCPPEIDVPLMPGSYISFSNASGTVTNVQATPDIAPDGNSSSIKTHGADSPGGATPAEENGIADIVMPINGILGIFLTDEQPNATSAPARRDYSSAAARDQATYDDILNKQPFFIGNGKTASNATQQFKVPIGATRLFLGTMDGHQWSNNCGSFSITITTPASVALVK